MLAMLDFLRSLAGSHFLAWSNVLILSVDRFDKLCVNKICALLVLLLAHSYLSGDSTSPIFSSVSSSCSAQWDDLKIFSGWCGFDEGSYNVLWFLFFCFSISKESWLRCQYEVQLWKTAASHRSLEVTTSLLAFSLPAVFLPYTRIHGLQHSRSYFTDYSRHV